MLRFTSLPLAAAFLIAAALAPPVPLSANPISLDTIWCWTDPVLVINGTPVHINVGVPVAQRHAASSALTVTVPANVKAMLAGTQAANFPVAVNLVRSGAHGGAGPVPVTATATVTAPAGTPSALKAWRPSAGTVAQTTGVAGKTMTISFGVQ